MVARKAYRAISINNKAAEQLNAKDIKHSQTFLACERVTRPLTLLPGGAHERTSAR